MSTFPENKPIEFPQAVPGTVDIGQVEKEVRQMTEKGYDFVRGAGAAFTGNLEGSVAGRTWTLIVSLAAGGQGAIADQYNLVRIDITGGGALGTGTELIISGKVQ
jgi:hypothetical protein